MTAFSEVHRDYINGPIWRERRQAFVDHLGAETGHYDADGVPFLPCLACGKRGDTEIHHLSYERVPGGELDSDLCPFCGSCHGKVHGLEPENAPNRNVALRGITADYLDSVGYAYEWPYDLRTGGEATTAPEAQVLGQYNGSPGAAVSTRPERGAVPVAVVLGVLATWLAVDAMGAWSLLALMMGLALVALLVVLSEGMVSR